MNFNYTGVDAAKTTQNRFILPNFNQGLTGTSATISINSNTWNNTTVDYNAETLLHEMAHLYDFVRGSGGFALKNRAEFADHQAFDKLIEDKCNIHF